MSQLLDDLKAVRELLSVPERWTQGQFARDRAKLPVPEKSGRALCFCIAGAAFRVADERGWYCIDAIHDCLGPEVNTTEWNDKPDRTHAEVLDLIDRCIAKAEASA